MLVVKNARTAQTLELDIDVDSLLPQDSGAHEAGSVEFDLYDPTLTFDLKGEDEITVSAVSSPSDLKFGGHVRSLADEIIAIGRKYHVIAYDYSTLLDRINVVQDSRPAGESDHARLVYFMTTYGSGLLDPDAAGIATLKASMPAQTFKLLTLRQAIEQVLATARETGTYRLNAYKKLDTWDSAPGLAAAPYDVVVGTPAGGQIAPENLAINADTSSLFNAYWVRGATAAGSGWFTDPASIAQWGRRERYIDAPDSDLAWKAYNVGHAALADTAQPKYRGTFTAVDGDWRANQRFALTSPMHNLVAAPFDTVRVTPRFLSGTALQALDIEFGSPKGSFAAKHGKEARRSTTGPGSGGWGATGGSGGTGGGSEDGGCGCPPYDCVTFDSFDSRSVGSGWGTVSSGIFGWTASGLDSQHFMSVASGVGTMSWSSVISGTIHAQIASVAGPWVQPAWSMLTLIRIPSVPPTGAYIVSFKVSGYTQLDVAIGDPSLADGFVDLDGTSVPFTWATGASYYIRFDYTYDGPMRAKVWHATDPEPLVWTVEGFSSNGAAPSVATLEVSTQISLAGAASDSIDFAFIDFCPPPNVGQSYPWTNLGTGNNVRTAFATLTPFTPGSLEVRVDTNTITPLTQTPATGAFDLPFPPSGIETVWGRWAVAATP